jgi:phospholipid/cholesterol/gamma-HCH transport system substrate-binding protein
MFAVIAALALLSTAMFAGTFRTFVPVTLAADRSGLVMESGAKVKLRGVEVGRVAQIAGGKETVQLKLELFPEQVQWIPANVEARIRATTAFGAKYVDLIYPENPSPERLTAGSVVRASNVSTEVNTVFENIVRVLDHIDPAKLNSVLTAMAEGVRGQGERMGRATSDANDVLLAWNSRADIIGEDWRSFKAFNDAYGTAAPDIIRVLDAVSTTSTTISDNSAQLDAMLLSVLGMTSRGIETFGPPMPDINAALNVLAPTTALLLKYSPTYACTIEGIVWFLEDAGGYEAIGGNGKSLVADAGLLLADDPYRYPDHLPIIGAKGGPGGEPGCGSLPDASKNFPVRYLVTNTGWGRGLDVRPNPGIGFPGWANYFPVTRAVPEPPSIRNTHGGPAIGPVPYPGAPPYGADLYADDGTPLWPGLPPAPPPSDQLPPDPDNLPPGTEPAPVHAPAQVTPTPLPPHR